MATATVPPTEVVVTPGDLRHRTNGRVVRNAIATTLIVVSVVLALVPLVAVVGYVIVKGASVIDWAFLTEPIPPPRRVGPGMGPAVYGTLVITGLATVMAVPLGILGAIYLHEYGGTSPFARLVRFLSYVMTGVPSIVMGLFIYTIFVLRFGVSGFAGSLALAALMLPVVIRTVEEMLKLVPDELRHGSYALGGRKWNTILRVILPAALPGITSGALLAVARAAGETAPLLFTILAVTEVNLNPFKGANTALSTQIFANAQQPFEGAQSRAYGAALVLVAIALAFTLVARLIASRFALKR